MGLYGEMDTIAAIGTALSEAGIGIIRISGDNAISIGDKVFQSKNKNKKLIHESSHTIHYGYLYSNDGNILDEVLVTVMRAPHSFTGEDTVEINCHGGVYLCKKALDCVLKAGARLASPGEFSKRAFLNGKIDLSKAEAIMDLIQSKNEFAASNAVKQLTGNLENKIIQLREEIIGEIAKIEAALDDPEHLALDDYETTLLEKNSSWMKEVKGYLHSIEDGRIKKEGIRTVILGKPNVGKSTFFNQFLKEDRAIVTDQPGTTRDILEDYINFDGIGLILMDTAGIRVTEDLVEKIGVEKAKSAGIDADLVLYVIDASIPLDENDEVIKSLIQHKKCLVILNKSDLEPVVSEELIKKWLSDHLLDIEVISLSAKEKIGFDILHEKIKQYFYNGSIQTENEFYITNIRQAQELQTAYDSLLLLNRSLKDHMSEDFLSIDLMAAYEALGRILGITLEDDLVDKIFSNFCLGK
jgi:tRNA modification GTPase